jgi:hypothetical protein
LNLATLSGFTRSRPSREGCHMSLLAGAGLPNQHLQRSRTHNGGPGSRGLVCPTWARGRAFAFLAADQGDPLVKLAAAIAGLSAAGRRPASKIIWPTPEDSNRTARRPACRCHRPPPGGPFLVRSACRARPRPDSPAQEGPSSPPWPPCLRRVGHSAPGWANSPRSPTGRRCRRVCAVWRNGGEGGLGAPGQAAIAAAPRAVCPSRGRAAHGGPRGG